MTAFPQQGGCVCGAVRFVLREDPVTVYACHCTDCQTETGSIGVVTVVARRSDVELSGSTPEDCRVTLSDGRVKGVLRCARCKGPVCGDSRGDGLMTLEAGAFDDTSWIVPAGHIWARSAQPWVSIPEDALRYETGPEDADWLEMTRAWKSRAQPM